MNVLRSFLFFGPGTGPGASDVSGLVSVGNDVEEGKVVPAPLVLHSGDDSLLLIFLPDRWSCFGSCQSVARAHTFAGYVAATRVFFWWGDVCGLENIRLVGPT